MMAAAEWALTYYYNRKSAHVCVRCGAQDERTLAGRSRCQKCAMLDCNAQKIYIAQRRADRKCTQCAAQDERTLAGGAHCQRCVEWNRKYQRIRRYDDRRARASVEENAP